MNAIILKFAHNFAHNNVIDMDQFKCSKYSQYSQYSKYRQYGSIDN